MWAPLGVKPGLVPGVYLIKVSPKTLMAGA
jgi:hypothetical protein